MTVTSDFSAVHRGVPNPTEPELRILTGAAARFEDCKLDTVLAIAPQPPAIDVLTQAVAQAHGTERLWMLTGGEPTLRPDLPKLLATLRDAGAPGLGLTTDALAFTNERATKILAASGLTHVRVILASKREDAHDWIMGKTGAWKHAVRASRIIREAGLTFEIDCPVTRPTAPYLVEAMEFFKGLDARRVWLRRLTGRGIARPIEVSLLARLGLISADLERAASMGARDGVDVVLEGFPLCTVPAARAHVLPVGGVQWALPDTPDWQPHHATFLPAHEHGCRTCPGAPLCAGAPSDLVRRFGRQEIDGLGQHLVRPAVVEPLEDRSGDVFPPVRAGRIPDMRLQDVRRTAALPELGDDPLVLIPPLGVPKHVRIAILAPSPVTTPPFADLPPVHAAEPTRGVRVRLVRAAQQGATRLRLSSAGLSHHPDAAELIREATRLMMSEVEVAGELSGLAKTGDLALRRLRGTTHVYAALLGPDAERHDAVVQSPGAFEQTLALLDRIATLVPGVHTGTYAILTDPADVPAYAEGWRSGLFPGEPMFRLAPQGGSLRALAEVARAEPEGALRDALAAVLPLDLLDRAPTLTPAAAATEAFGDTPEIYAQPSALDRLGSYQNRTASLSDPQPGTCPGYAVGWSF